jgi:hypothetical protein
MFRRVKLIGQGLGQGAGASVAPQGTRGPWEVRLGGTRGQVQLLAYAKRLGNGAVYKRLGFLLERLAPSEVHTIKECRRLMSAGTAKLDPALPSPKLVTRWRLSIPTG